MARYSGIEGVEKLLYWDRGAKTGYTGLERLDGLVLGG